MSAPLTVCVATQHLLRNPDLGGHAWVYLNWILGCEANGCDVVVLESIRDGETAADAVGRVQSLHRWLRMFGARADVAVVCGAEVEARLAEVRDELAEWTVPVQAATERADLLLNFYYALESDLVRRFSRSALVDIDPGLLQTWLVEGQLHAAPHDVYFTIGETVGRRDTKIPPTDQDWHYTRPPVFLPAWPTVEVGSDAPYTTVANWWSKSNWEVWRGEVVNNEKRTSFLDYLELPSRAVARLELALYMKPEPDPDQALLESHGWTVRNSAVLASTPERYRAYIQGSRGEFSCAKPSCMRFENAWISDRTLCYLASGKPCILQHTGPSRFLPDGEGMFRFRSMAEAAAAIDAIESDYGRHSRHARRLAEEFFDAQAVVGRVIDTALEVTARRRPAAAGRA